MYVILCQLASLRHIMSFCIPLIHSHKHLHINCARHCASHWDIMIWCTPKMQINHYLCKRIRKIRFFSKMRPYAKYKVFLLVVSYHIPVTAFLDWKLALKVSYYSLYSLDHFWSQKSIFWSTWPHINHSVLKRICKLNFNIKTQNWRQFII